MNSKPTYSTEYWNSIVESMEHRYHIDDVLCKHKKDTYLNLISRWTDLSDCKKLLKTDLFEEAAGADDLLFDLAGQVGEAYGMDISSVATAKTMQRAQRLTIGNIECVCCDIRKLPFESESFDVIVSNSTLDHFDNKGDIRRALEELRRILKPDGALILTMDNKSNWSDVFFRLWINLGLAPYFSGCTYSIKEAINILNEIGFYVCESTTIIHNPRLVTKWFARLLHAINPARSPVWIGKCLRLLDKLENSRYKHFTGLYIAIKAVKKSHRQ